MRALKHLLAAIVCTLGSLAALATSEKGQIRIVSWNMNPVMPAAITDWPSLPGGFVLTAQSSLPEGVNSRLVVRIQQASHIVCGNTSATGVPISTFGSRSFSAADISGALSACGPLPQGKYSICLQFFGEHGEALSAETCKDFMVETSGSNASGSVVSAPVNIAPVDGKFYVADETKSPITFSWKAVTPLPQEKVIYRFRLWAVADGQSSKSATDAQPIITKDIDGATQTVLQNEIPIPCKAPYQCKYVWNVQALNSAGQSIGTNNGFSEVFAIVVTNYIIQINDIKVACTATPGVYSFSYVVANVNPGTAKLTNFFVSTSVPGGAAITSFSPPLNTTIVSGGTLTITGTISASPTLSNICIAAQITDVGNPVWLAQRDTCIPVLPCKCEACDPKKVNIAITPTTNIVVNGNNTITLNQPITVTTTPLKLVQSIKAELQYFEFVPESEECLTCNRDSKTFGNMDNGSLPPATGTGGGTHALLWTYTPPKNFSTASTASITFTIPPTVKCCAATVRWCIRYVITFSDCTVCNKLVCYEKKKDGCGAGTGTGTGNGVPNN